MFFKKKKCVIFDIDGVVSDWTHRKHLLLRVDLHKNKSEYVRNFIKKSYKDPVIKNMDQIINCFSKKFKIVYLTGRREEFRILTENWLLNNIGNHKFELIMKPNSLAVNSLIFKRDQINKIGKGNIVAVFEDRKDIVQMYKENDILVFRP